MAQRGCYPDRMRILITGAAGRVGSAVATDLHKNGHEVVATDVMYRPELPFKLHLADLCDYRSIYPLIEGCDAVIHLGNHPHARATRPYQKLMAENVAMNANVFAAALDVGIRRIVSISSVQATTGVDGSKVWGRVAKTCQWPYLPADGKLPRNPGNNEYALSKVFAEQTLEAMAAEHEDLAAVTVRFPWVQHAIRNSKWRYDSPLKPDDKRVAEGMGYVTSEDACTSLRAIVEQVQPGYHQYFVAQSLVVRGMTCDEMAARLFPAQEVTGPFVGDGGLIDLTVLKEQYGWSPAAPPLEVELVESDDSTQA